MELWTRRARGVCGMNECDYKCKSDGESTNSISAIHLPKEACTFSAVPRRGQHGQASGR